MTQKCIEGKSLPVRLLPQSQQTWPQQIGRTFSVVLHDGVTVRGVYLGEVRPNVMAFRLDGEAILFSVLTLDGRPSRKLIAHQGGRKGARR
mgnify:CR=1 FL=1